jgi:hypothetical protein
MVSLSMSFGSSTIGNAAWSSKYKATFFTNSEVGEGGDAIPSHQGNER